MIRLGKTIHLVFFGIVAISVMALSGCKVKRATQISPLVKLNESAILEQMMASQFDFDQLSAKMSVSMRSDAVNGSFKINLRMAEDSLIWMSISPALGIEAARVLVDQDSIKFIDKLKDRYYLGEYSYLDSVFQYAVAFEFLENLLVGNPLEITPDEKYNSVTDDLYYVIQTKNPRKLRKALNLSKKIQVPDTTLAEVAREKKFSKALEKFEGSDLVVKRYYVRAQDFRVSRTIIEDLELGRTVVVDYSDFVSLDGKSFPMKVHLEVKSGDRSALFDLEFSRVRTHVDQSYPFKVPDSYEAIR